MAGLPRTTIQIAFATDPGAAPTWVDVSAYVRRWSTRRGRQHELDRVEAGTATVTLTNTDGRFDPANLAGPYGGHVLPMRRIRIRATWGATTFEIFSGYVESWHQNVDPGPMGDASVDLTCVDGFKALAAAQVVIDRPLENASTRIAAVLDLAGWPAGARALDNGACDVAVASSGEELRSSQALAHIQDVASSEGGVFFISGAGIATFFSRTKPVVTPFLPLTHTWGDTASEYLYVELERAFDDSRVINDVSVSSSGLTTQTASDATSQTTYLLHSLPLSTVLAAEPDMASRAAHLIAKYKDAAERISALVLDARAQDDQWPQLLGAELQDLIRVVKHRPSWTISQDSFVEGISHDVTPGRWISTWALSPRDPTYDAAGWVLGDAVKGVLDSTTILWW